MDGTATRGSSYLDEEERNSLSGRVTWRGAYNPRTTPSFEEGQIGSKLLEILVGTPGFEPGTP
jgi:hypothetical protein